MGEWRKVRLGDHISIKHGYAFKGEYFSENGAGPILVTPGNFAIGGGFRFGKVKHYLGPVPEEYVLDEGDLIVTMTDLSKAADTLGYSAIVPGGYTYLHNQRIGLVKITDPDTLEKSYLHYALRSPAYRSHVLASASGSTVRHTSPSRICDYVFRVPDRGEQRAIAAVLGALDDKIAVNERIADTALSLANAAYLSCVADASESVLVSDVLELKYGKSLPAARRVDGGVPVFGSGGISGSHNEPLVEGPGVIVGRKGTVGSVYWSECDFFPIDTAFYVHIKRADVPMEFAYFALSNLGLDAMNSDSAVPGLNRNNVHALPLMLPAKESIRQFGDQVRSMFELRESVSLENKSLAQLRDTLLPKLMSGQLRVRDAEKMVEDAT